MAPTELPPNNPSKRSPSQDSNEEAGSDKQLSVAGMMIGTSLMFLGFLQVFLSISGGFELGGVVAMLLYFGGLAIWANAVIENLAIRYSVMGGAIALALGFYHYGEVLFWHKQVIFWGTVVVIMYFMFNEPKKPAG
jgi:hypothetical protein